MGIPPSTPPSATCIRGFPVLKPSSDALGVSALSCAKPFWIGLYIRVVAVMTGAIRPTVMIGGVIYHNINRNNNLIAIITASVIIAVLAVMPRTVVVMILLLWLSLL